MQGGRSCATGGRRTVRVCSERKVLPGRTTEINYFVAELVKTVVIYMLLNGFRIAFNKSLHAFREPAFGEFSENLLSGT